MMPRPPKPEIPLGHVETLRLKSMTAVDLRLEAWRWETLARAAKREGDEWDADDCRSMAQHCRRFARRQEIT